MDLLVLGGTKFLGRALAAEALSRGHRVTLFTRGVTNPNLFAEAEHVRGDRTESLDGLTGRSFDAVVDTCGYHPGPVGRSASAVRAALYCFVSSLSVYADASRPGLHEDAPLAALPGELPAEYDPERYGPLKALCERAVVERAARALIVRPGLIVGPHDPSDRFTYWPVRAARGGSILAPGAPDRAVQVIDVRDLAAWMLAAVERGRDGVFNATGPASPLSMAALLDACRDSAGAPSSVEWVDEAFLLERKVEPWIELPVWLPSGGEHAGLFSADVSRALAEGLTFRPLVETARDTLAWFAREGRTLENAGLAPEREAELLAAWSGRS